MFFVLVREQGYLIKKHQKWVQVSRDGSLHPRDCEIVTVLWIEHLLQQKRSSVWCFSASNKSYHGWQDIISEGLCLPDRLSKDRWIHEDHFLFPFSCPIILEKFIFKCLKLRAIKPNLSTAVTANSDIILPVFAFHRNKLFILQFLIWHKTMLNPKKFWT